MSRIYEFDYYEQSKALKTRLHILTLNRIRIASFISKIHRTQLAGKIRIKCQIRIGLVCEDKRTLLKLQFDKIQIDDEENCSSIPI